MMLVLTLAFISIGIGCGLVAYGGIGFIIARKNTNRFIAQCKEETLRE